MVLRFKKYANLSDTFSFLPIYWQRPTVTIHLVKLLFTGWDDLKERDWMFEGQKQYRMFWCADEKEWACGPELKQEQRPKYYNLKGTEVDCELWEFWEKYITYW